MTDFKDRQLYIEDYLQMVSTESKEYAEVSSCQRIAENNYIITVFQTDRILVWHISAKSVAKMKNKLYRIDKKE